MPSVGMPLRLREEGCGSERARRDVAGAAVGVRRQRGAKTENHGRESRADQRRACAPSTLAPESAAARVSAARAAVRASPPEGS